MGHTAVPCFGFLITEKQLQLNDAIYKFYNKKEIGLFWLTFVEVSAAKCCD